MNRKPNRVLSGKQNSLWQAKLSMTEAALAMLQNDPRRVEKAERALKRLKAAEEAEAKV